MLDIWKGRIKGKDKYETWENYCFLFIAIGAGMLSIGIGLTVITTKGIPVIIAMLGSFISFISTVILILVWLIKELFGE